MTPKFLFVPVSCVKGIGEYIRSTIIADEILRYWPHAHIEFVLNRHAPYAKHCPFKAHLVDDTPTKQITAVNDLVSQLQPDVVIFDAAGRRVQLEHAKRNGAKVVFVSQHRRKRARGMRIERARVTDSHWVVQPEFVIGDIGPVDRLKLKLIKSPPPIFTGSIFSRPDPQIQQQLMDKYHLKPKTYLLYSAGSGGHRYGDEFAAERFAQAAQAHYAQFGVPSLMVFGPNYPKPLPALSGVIAIKALSSGEFIGLLAQAKAAILSGGDTLLQAIALKVPTLALVVSKDQPYRIKRCLARELVLTCEAKVPAMVAQITHLLRPDVVEQLRINMDMSCQSNGLDICMSELSRLLGLARAS